MKRFVEQEERSQIILFPERLDDYINEDNAVRVVDVFVKGLHLAALGFEGVTRAKTGHSFSLAWRSEGTSPKFSNA